MATKGRRCVLGCSVYQITLFPFPANAVLRARWLEFLHYEERGLSSRTCVCTRHFTRECFTNYKEYSMGFVRSLSLTDIAVPSVYTVGVSPASKPLTQDVGCQQTPPRMKAASTQTELNRRNKGVQVCPGARSVSAGCSFEDFPPLRSTPVKRPRFELESNDIESFGPREVREEDQESTASIMMTTMGSQTDGGPSRKTRLLTEDVKKETDQESENGLDTFAEVELTIDSDSSDEPQRSQEDSDGGEEEEEEEEEAEKGEGGVQNKDIESEEGEAEGTEKSETAEEEDEWEMEDDEESEDEVRKVRKRLRDDGASHPRHYRRREIIMKRQQNRPETLCTDCGRIYKTMTHRCDPENKFQCPDCGVFFLTGLSLSVHGNGYCRRRHHLCTFCLKPFKTRQEKLAHEISHTGERLYECPECPQRFLDRATRNCHLKEHPKTFRCQTCQKEFPTSRMLQRHEMSHSGANKPFKCQVCDRVFAQASQLKSHLRVHTGEKPFHCQLCPKCFNHNVSLKNHIRRYHQGESHDNPGPALREQEEGYHGPEPEADDGAEQERVEGREMKHGRSQKQEDVTFWTELNIAQRGNSGGMQGCQWLPVYSEKHQEDSQGMLNNQDSDFDPEEKRIIRKRRGRGRGRGRVQPHKM